MRTTTPAAAASKAAMSLTRLISTVLLCVVLGHVQVRAQQPAATSVAPSDLERVRRALVRDPSIFAVDVVPDYRVRVETEQEDLRLKLAWIYDDTTVPGYVRPWYPIYHFEMQQMMLPRDFRAHLYPIGVPAGDVIRAFSDAMRARRERAARERVRAEIEALRLATSSSPLPEDSSAPVVTPQKPQPPGLPQP